MLKQTMPILAQDSEAAKRLADFLPEKIFDAHAHLLDTAHLPSMRVGMDHDLILDIETYRREMMPLLCEPKELRLNVIAFPDGAMSNLTQRSFSTATVLSWSSLKRTRKGDLTS